MNKAVRKRRQRDMITGMLIGITIGIAAGVLASAVLLGYCLQAGVL